MCGVGRVLWTCASGEKQSQFAGTLGYMAPEVFSGQYGPEIDVWSAGAVLYFMLCGVPPFWGSSLASVRAATLGRDVSFNSSKWAHVSEGCKTFLRALLTKDPSLRPTISEAMGELPSPNYPPRSHNLNPGTVVIVFVRNHFGSCPRVLRA